jgi:hypothetical protein
MRLLFCTAAQHHERDGHGDRGFRPEGSRFRGTTRGDKDERTHERRELVARDGR